MNNRHRSSQLHSRARTRAGSVPQPAPALPRGAWLHRMSSCAQTGVCAGVLVGTAVAGCAGGDARPDVPDKSQVAARVGSTPASGAGALPAPGTLTAVAASSAAALVARRPAFLNASANDAFVQGKVVSSSATFYVPYERTYAGLRVVGGDLVIVLDSAGQEVYHSVALERPLGTLSMTPTLNRPAAEAIAVGLLRRVTRVEDWP